MPGEDEGTMQVVIRLPARLYKLTERDRAEKRFTSICVRLIEGYYLPGDENALAEVEARKSTLERELATTLAQVRALQEKAAAAKAEGNEAWAFLRKVRARIASSGNRISAREWENWGKATQWTERLGATRFWQIVSEETGVDWAQRGGVQP